MALESVQRLCTFKRPLSARALTDSGAGVAPVPRWSLPDVLGVGELMERLLLQEVPGGLTSCQRPAGEAPSGLSRPVIGGSGVPGPTPQPRPGAIKRRAVASGFK